MRCRFFRKRIYNESNIDKRFAEEKQQECPLEGGDDNLSAFDSTSSFRFDNAFYKNLLQQKGVVHSDQQLLNDVNGTDSPTKDQVVSYARNMGKFKKDFAAAMLKMSMMTPLTGSDGEIRQNCSRVNPPSTWPTSSSIISIQSNKAFFFRLFLTFNCNLMHLLNTSFSYHFYHTCKVTIIFVIYIVLW